MTKLIITVGLIASGKTTWAKEYISQHPEFVRVNRDDLRSMIINGKWSRDKEKNIIKARDSLIISYLTSNRSVICDDTNLSLHTQNHLKQIIENLNKAHKLDVEFEIKDFRDIPLEICLERDEKRDNRIGRNAILEMYYQYIFKPDVPLAYNPGLKDCILYDLDGTLSLIPEGKNHYDRDFENDIVNEKVLYLINHLPAMPIFVSGRKDRYTVQTMKFLSNKCNMNSGFGLFMRKDDDNRPDYVIKKEIFDNYIKYNYNVLFVVDDRKQMKKMWIGLGLFVLDVNQYDLEF